MKYKKKILKNNIKFFIRPNKEDEYILEEVWGKEGYQKLDFKIKDYFTVIDIGAHIGFFTIYSALHAKRVFSYEPDPRNFKLLEKNIIENKLKNINIFNFAVFNKKERIKLFLNKNSPVKNSLLRNYPKFIMVNATSIKDIFEENKIDFCHLLKIDAEGSEYEILCNTPQEYLMKIESIILEYHDSIVKQSLKRLIKLFNRVGFKIVKTTSYNFNQGILLIKKSKKSKKLIFKNYLEYFLLKSLKPELLKIDMFLGKIGILLKINHPKLYFKLKKLKKEN